MFELDMFSKVEVHPYRTARVNGLFEIDRTTVEWKKFEAKLAETAGVNLDNHVVYTVRKGNSVLHFWCSDLWVQVGSTLIKERW